MATIIRNRKLVPDGWQRLEIGADGELPDVPPEGDIMVPLVLWRARRDALLAHPGRIGLVLAAHEGPEAAAEDLAGFGVIAVDFPRFTDGRGYSTARLLRERYGYRGELRAVGDVQRDQLYYLARCGFDSFALRDGDDPEAALAAFDDFSIAYQGAADQPVPLFQRRGPDVPEGPEGL